MPWSIKNSPNPIVCRPALPIDTPDVIELTRQIWEGEDYVPKVWAEWLAEPEGMLAVAECEGVIVGLGKLTKLSADDWWLEGLRVHPDFEGRGIASRLNKYLLDYWLRIGSGVIRLATGSHREPVKHLSIKMGFRTIGEYSTFKAPTIKSTNDYAGRSNFKPLMFEEINEAIDWLRNPSQELLSFDLMDLGWQWAKPKAEYFENYAKSQQIWWWRERLGLLIMVTKKEGSDMWARIRMLACDNDDLTNCLTDARSLADQAGYKGLSWLAPLSPEIESSLTPAGFIRDWESSLLIYEKRFPQR